MDRALRHRCTPRAVQGPAIRRSRVHGFTLLEMAIAVSIIGVLGMAVSSAYFGIADVRARARGQAEAEVARQSVRAFMLRNKRLPCPDLSTGGSGAREGLAGSCPAGAQIGWLPYESLGLAPPEPRHRMRYAVARAGTGADLVTPLTDVADGLDLDGVTRLRRTLMAAANQTPASNRPYLTGTGGPANPESCSGNVVANPAFAVIAPVNDRDDSGSQYPGFDGINQSMAAANTLCIAAPDRRMDATYDDVVVAESATALLGWLAAQTR
ncbi:MAG TPA: type II secretion system protein [Lysobacter sp.]|jgi:prepilin-type N-terminal cleavage/methylation domain-containing protein|nr:type II secretion system protein [Lysobacter sp.]